MTATHLEAFQARTRDLFSVEAGEVPRMIWVLGPPGAGKTTWATRRARGASRVFDIEEILFWRDGADLGVRSAKRHMVEAIRAVESRRVAEERTLWITGSYLDPEDLGRLGDREHVVAVIPEEARWRERLRRREGSVSSAAAEEHARCVQAWGVGALAADRVSFSERTR